MVYHPPRLGSSRHQHRCCRGFHRSCHVVLQRIEPRTGSSGHHVQRVASRRLPTVLHGRVVPLHHETYHLQLRIPPHRLVRPPRDRRIAERFGKRHATIVLLYPGITIRTNTAIRLRDPVRLAINTGLGFINNVKMEEFIKFIKFIRFIKSRVSFGQCFNGSSSCR